MLELHNYKERNFCVDILANKVGGDSTVSLFFFCTPNLLFLLLIFFLKSDIFVLKQEKYIYQVYIRGSSENPSTLELGVSHFWHMIHLGSLVTTLFGMNNLSFLKKK